MDGNTKHTKLDELITIFAQEQKNKTRMFVHQDKIEVGNSQCEFHIVLGSCASVVLCGLDQEKRPWVGLNHLFRSRRDNLDIALHQIVAIRDKLIGKGVQRVNCLGIFGAGYKLNSPAKKVAQENIMHILEALVIFNMNIDLFQTGFSQAVTILTSESRRSFLIRYKGIAVGSNIKTEKIVERPFSALNL